MNHLKTRTLTGILTLGALPLALLVGPASASPGELDPGFGVGGRVIVDDSAQDGALAQAVQADGKVVVVGYTDREGSADALVLRLNPDGSEDLDFGRRRLAVPGGGQDFADSVAVQPDGRIVVAGKTETNEDAVLWRLLPSGEPDTTFGGGDGLVTVDNGGEEYFADVALATDGSIVAVGQTRFSGSALAAIYRFTAAGDPDTTFDKDGKIGIGAGYSHAEGVALQPDGKVLVTGWFGSSDAPSHGLHVRRLEADGDVDHTFGEGDGEASAYGLVGTGADVLVQADGRVVVVGSHQLPYGQVGSAARYTPAGRVDPTFTASADRDGRFIDAGGLGTGVLSVATLPDGGYVVSGYRFPAAGSFAGVALRLRPNGTPDQAFGPDGVVDLGGGSYAGTEITVQPDGKAVVAGLGEAAQDVLVHRVLTSTDPAPTGTPATGTPGLPSTTERCHGRTATIVGTAGKDRIRGTARADVIVALGGGDIVTGRGGDDTVCAGAGADAVFGDSGGDRLHGEGGKDRLVGGRGKDRLVGGPGRDATRQHQ